MTDLDKYLAQYFLNAEGFAAACSISIEELDELIESKLIPAPSYIVTDSSILCSCVFGKLEAQGSTPGRYFRPEKTVWTNIAQDALKSDGDNAAAFLKQQFASNYQAALKELNTTTHRLPECFTDEGDPIRSGLNEQTEHIWEHFLAGTFGLCVANPISEAQIARKGVLQQRLNQQTDNGKRIKYTPSQAKETLDLINTYAEASMPFSPVEYPLSSKKRLVDDPRSYLESLHSS